MGRTFQSRRGGDTAPYLRVGVFHRVERIERMGRARCPQRAGIATAALDFTVESKVQPQLRFMEREPASPPFINRGGNYKMRLAEGPGDERPEVIPRQNNQHSAVSNVTPERSL